jgi:hypothetical protein
MRWTGKDPRAAKQSETCVQFGGEGLATAPICPVSLVKKVDFRLSPNSLTSTLITPLLPPSIPSEASSTCLPRSTTPRSSHPPNSRSRLTSAVELPFEKSTRLASLGSTRRLAWSLVSGCKSSILPHRASRASRRNPRFDPDQLSSRSSTEWLTPIFLPSASPMRTTSSPSLSPLP